MQAKLFLAGLLLLSLGLANAANILAVFNVPSKSHHIFNIPLAIALAEKGHNVTVISTMPLKKNITNMSNIVIEGMHEFIQQVWDKQGREPEKNSEDSPFATVPARAEWVQKVGEFTLQNVAMKTLLSYPEDFEFDLIILEPISGEALFGIGKRFGSPPIAIVSAFSHPQWINDMVGNPSNPSYIPDIMFPFSDHMTFQERMKNTLLNIFEQYLWNYRFLPAIDEIAVKGLGSSTYLPSEMFYKVSLALVNTNPVFDYPRPLLPSVINVAGIHIDEPKPLPKDIKQFLDEAKDGAIFFSLGSNLRSDKLKEDKRKAFLEAFAELPQRVLLKFESDMEGLPKNVKVGKWLPQSDILAHPNMRLFITHSGLMSTLEAIQRGVPVVGIPFIGDQFVNTNKAKNYGVGEKLEYKGITKESVLKAIRTVLEDPSYTKNIKELSARFQDQPQTPRERAVYWCEYVIRHKGAPHLRSAAMDLTWYQYLLLDVIAVLVATLLTPLILIGCCCKRIFSKTQKQVKMKKH